MLARVVSIMAPVLLCAGLALGDGQGVGGGQNPQGPGQPLGNPQTQAAPSSQLAAPQGGIVAIYELPGTLDDIVGGFALGHPYFVFTSGGTTYEIKAAPYRFLANLNLPALVGETILMKFAECRQGSYLALQITYGTTVYVLRDDNGKPVWRQWPVDTATGSSDTATVDPFSVETISVVVDNVGTSMVSHTVRVRVRLRDQQLAWVTLGPDSLLLDQGFEVQVGDRLTIMLAVRAANRERVALQVENPDTGQRALLRNREGHQYRLMYD